MSEATDKPELQKHGQAFEVRLAAAMTFLEHERDRERSLTNLGLAIGTAATAALALAGQTLAGMSTSQLRSLATSRS